MFSVYTTPQEFENGGLTMVSRGLTRKMHQMFSVHTMPKELKNLITQQLPVILDVFVFDWKSQSGKSHDHRDVIVFEKLSKFSKCFPSTQKRKVGVFKFLSPV